MTAVLRTRTAFTHPRRLQILKALAGGEKDGEALRVATGISARALNRHLAKLTSRGVVVMEGIRFRLSRDGTPLSLCLLTLATRDS